MRFLPILASQLQLVRIGRHFLVPEKAGLLVVERLNLQITPHRVQIFYKTPLRMLNLPKTLLIGCVTEQKHPSRGEGRQFESGKCPLWGERANPLTPRTNPGVNGANQAFYAFFLRSVFHVLPKLWKYTNQISSVFWKKKNSSYWNCMHNARASAWESWRFSTDTRYFCCHKYNLTWQCEGNHFI